jgi:hypothetical protein
MNNVGRTKWPRNLHPLPKQFRVFADFFPKSPGLNLKNDYVQEWPLSSHIRNRRSLKPCVNPSGFITVARYLNEPA